MAMTYTFSLGTERDSETEALLSSLYSAHTLGPCLTLETACPSDKGKLHSSRPNCNMKSKGNFPNNPRVTLAARYLLRALWAISSQHFLIKL